MPQSSQNAPQSAASEPASVQIHETTFAKNARTGLWRGSCVCGWVKFGGREEVQSRAATHDMEWQAADPAADETPPFWTQAQP